MTRRLALADVFKRGHRADGVFYRRDITPTEVLNRHLKERLLNELRQCECQLASLHAIAQDAATRAEHHVRLLAIAIEKGYPSAPARHRREAQRWIDRGQLWAARANVVRADLRHNFRLIISQRPDLALPGEGF